MAREFNKRKTRTAGKQPDRKPLPAAGRRQQAFGKFHRKPSFNPNKDLEGGEESYSSQKRKNLREEDRKGPYERKPLPDLPAAGRRQQAFERKSSDKKPLPGGRQGFRRKKPVGQSYKKVSENESLSKKDGLIRLNKYISNAGICSRREADDLIKAGAVKVNGIVVTEMGYKVKPDDQINYGGETLRKEKLVYVLLNKPKDFITTLEDPGKRKTVYDLIKNACRERIYPVGRLDRNTTGVLLLTNDGELTKKLTHPKHGIKKIYHVTLDKPLAKPDLDSIAKNGVELEDGHILPDQIHYAADGSNKKEVGLEIHSGRNRIVRRLFEHLGYEVLKLDRVVFAGLTKKDLPRGNYRLLTEQEVGFLKMLA